MTRPDWVSLIIFVPLLTFIGCGIEEVQNEAVSTQRVLEAHKKFDHDEVKTVNTPIYSLSMADTMSGSISGSQDGSISGLFFLGYGGIDGHIQGSLNGSMSQYPVYSFYVDDGDSGFILRRINAETTSLKYMKANETPHLSVTTKYHFDVERGRTGQVVSTVLVIPHNYRLLGQFKSGDQQ